MKRTLCRTLVCLLLVLAAAAPLTASANDLGYVIDDAWILDSGERTKLEQKAREISERYQCGVYIITLKNYQDFGRTPAGATEQIYQQYGFGLGGGRDGVMLMLSMSGRDYDVYFTDGIMDTVFTSYGQDKLEEHFLDDFRRNDWYGGFEDYLSDCEKYLSMASNGIPFDSRNDIGVILKKVGIAVLVSCVVALIICFCMKSGMKSVRRSTEAKAYIVANSAQLRICTDTFTHATETRRTIESNSSKSGGRSAGGGGASSHRSGKF